MANGKGREPGLLLIASLATFIIITVSKKRKSFSKIQRNHEEGRKKPRLR
jgi:hypothetical protein